MRHAGLHSQFVDRSNSPYLSSGQKNDAITNTLGVCELVYSQNERASSCRLTTEHVHDVAGLAKIETVEWLIHKQHALPRQETHGQEQASMVLATSAPDRR